MRALGKVRGVGTEKTRRVPDRMDRDAAGSEGINFQD